MREEAIEELVEQCRRLNLAQTKVLDAMGAIDMDRRSVAITLTDDGTTLEVFLQEGDGEEGERFILNMDTQHLGARLMKAIQWMLREEYVESQDKLMNATSNKTE